LVLFHVVYDMPVKVLLFASYAEAFGTSSLHVDVEAGLTVRELVADLRERGCPHALPEAPLVAVNEIYAHPDQVIGAGDEVAIIPPVAGG